MVNRHQRRVVEAQKRHLARAARLRCVSCERVGQPMTREHFWPLWLINHANVHEEGVAWLNDKRVHPKNATLPLCNECNNSLGSFLEGPVSRILPKIEQGLGINDKEAELLARWLWKFEGLGACYRKAGDPEWKYSAHFTLIERVLGNSMDEAREELTLAVGLIHANDPDFIDWPMGLDSGDSGINSTFVSGVFGRTALMIGLRQFDSLIPGCFGLYHFPRDKRDSEEACFWPPVCFPRSSDAIAVTKGASKALEFGHEKLALEQQRARFIAPGWSKVIIPN
jgi:hypothetical protein